MPVRRRTSPAPRRCFWAVWAGATEPEYCCALKSEARSRWVDVGGSQTKGGGGGGGRGLQCSNDAEAHK